MDRSFIRPLLIVVIVVLLLVVIAPFIPSWENEILPIKTLDIVGSLTAKPDSQVASAIAVEVAQKPPSIEELLPLDAFTTRMQALKTGSKEQLRIAYFGDSIIEGDYLTGRLRKNLQQDFGGRGIGLVGITSIVNEYRKTIRHSFSTNWETQSFMTKSGALGIMGHTYIPRSWQLVETKVIEEVEHAPVPDTSDSLITEQPPPKTTIEKTETRKVNVGGTAWVEYLGVDYPGGASTFETIRLFYSHAQEGSSLRVTYDSSNKQTYNLAGGEQLQVLDLTQPSPIKKIRLEFSTSHPIRVYGLSFDAPTGVYVDNISIRGYSGMDFGRIPKELLSSFQKALGIDLIILQYGENVTSPKNTSYEFYRKGMINSVHHIQEAIPDVPILIISAHDRSVKRDMGYQTSPDIPILIKAQSDFAKETGAAFWNLFAEMGGMHSMKEWVNASPPLAAKDYTHFSIAGAQKVGDMLTGLIRHGSQKAKN